jgi:hypothetical protein
MQRRLRAMGVQASRAIASRARFGTRDVRVSFPLAILPADWTGSGHAERNHAAWNPMSLARWNPMSSARWQFPSLGPRALAAKASGYALASALSPLALARARAGPPSARATPGSRLSSIWLPAHRRLSHPPAPRRDSARAAPALILDAAFLTDAPEAMCMSPEREYPCDGMCKHPSAEERGDVARVVCLSACGDPERAWEMRDDKASVRQTMTSVGALAARPRSLLILLLPAGAYICPGCVCGGGRERRI